MVERVMRCKVQRKPVNKQVDLLYMQSKSGQVTGILGGCWIVPLMKKRSDRFDELSLY
jgi:hypothetical protein